MFLVDGAATEGWHKLEACNAGARRPYEGLLLLFVVCSQGTDSRAASAAMGLLYVRIGAPLVNLAEGASGPAAIYLEEALPEFKDESAHTMEPVPAASMSQSRVLSLAVSLCDVRRVREYLLRGGSIKSPVIIGRGVTGTPLVSESRDVVACSAHVPRSRRRPHAPTARRPPSASACESSLTVARTHVCGAPTTLSRLPRCC